MAFGESLLLGVLGYLLYIFYEDGFTFFSLHPSLVSLGWLLFMTQGVLSLSGDYLLVKKISVKRRIVIHWITISIGTCLILAGCVVIYLHKNSINKSHLATRHAKLGFVSLILVFCTIPAGVITHRYKFRNRRSQVRMKAVHNILGLLNLILATVVIILGLCSTWFENVGTFIGQFVSIYVICLGMLLVIVKPAATTYRRYVKAWL